MAYYPKSQIKTNLHTNGGEFQSVPTRLEYVGYYWTISNGKFYSGRTPQDTPVFEIVPLFKTYSLTSNQKTSDSFSEIALQSDKISNEYLLLNDFLYNSTLVQTYTNVNKIDQTPKLVPTYLPTIPTQQDYTYGKYTRYFCKKINEIIYLEISKDTYSKLVSKDPQILWPLYQPFNIPWQLTGKEEDVYKANKNVTELISFKQKLPMLSEYLKNDFTKYYK